MTEILDPQREIVDPHHHLWSGDARGTYAVADLHADTGSGHRVVQTVFIETRTHYRTEGPEHLRPAGETEWVARIARDATAAGPDIAGIVSFADLTLGPLLEELLDAHQAAGDGRFRGIRRPLARANHPPWSKHLPKPAPEGLAGQPEFRTGVTALGKRGLVYETWLYHYQLEEFIALARAVPDTVMVLDHFGTPVGVAQYTERRAEVYQQTMALLRQAAECPNVMAKLGGLAQPDNGFGWHERNEPVTAEEIVAAQRDYYLQAIDYFGPSRCMFESNFPVDKVSVGYAELYNAFKLMTRNFSEADKNALFSGTARRVYGLAG